MLRQKPFLGMGLAMLIMLFGSLAMAQSNEIILTVGLYEYQMDMLNERILQGFYDAHPGVKVVPVAINEDALSVYGLTPFDISGNLEAADAYFSQADIVAGGQYTIDPLVTRANYVVDLAPYIRAESTSDDFYPLALKTFEWDNGLWGLPVALHINFVAYRPDAFDKVGYPYPESFWGLNDYLDAGRALTVHDENGNIIMPGFYAFNESVLVRALLDHGFYNDSTQPEIPDFSDPEIATMLEELDLYFEDFKEEEAKNTLLNLDLNKVPLRIEGSWLLDEDQKDPFQLALFPNETAIVSSDGFAISAGTPYPDLAFELIMYLTSDIEIVSRFWGDSPARRSLAGQTGSSITVMPTPKVIADLLPSILENGLPFSEMRYGLYVYIARLKMSRDETLSASEALRQVQEQAILDLALVEAHGKKTKVVAVATPVPTPVLSTDEVALKFLLQANVSPLPNRDAWDRVIQDFTEMDPQVGHIDLITNSRSLRDDYKVVDCAYSASSVVPWIDISLIQPLDPFLATDSTFDRSDIPEGIWPSVMRDEKIYGLPLTLTPVMMWYNVNTFEASDTLPPSNGWMVSDFVEVLKSLKEAQPQITPYRSQTFGNTPYVLLAAAMGGMPIDYSTPMPTYHLTDPIVVEALRQTLDLAKEGYIEYVELGGEQIVVPGMSRTALYDTSGGLFDWDELGTESNPYHPVTFPQGVGTLPLAYNVGAAYITSQTPYADACYRWLSTLAQHPELFPEMPIRRSFATDETLIATHGQTTFDFYGSLFDLLDSPQAVFVPVGYTPGPGSTGRFIADIWFNKALDAYVLEDRDLETALAEAQTHIDEYSACIAEIPPFDYEDGQWAAYDKQFIDCAVSVDPSLAPRFKS